MAGARRFLVVRLAGREYAVPASRVGGMVQARGLDIQRVDGHGPLRYLAQLHGRAVPVFVPNRTLGLKELPVSARTCVLLIEDGDAEHPRCALMVDSISRIEDVPAPLARPSGQVRLGDKWRDVLDVDRLCQTPRSATT